jgi:hypothetical protein
MTVEFEHEQRGLGRIDDPVRRNAHRGVRQPLEPQVHGVARRGEHLHHQQRIGSDPVQIVGVPREYQQVRLQ